FKMDSAVLDRRIEQLAAEGVRFITHCQVGVDLNVAELQHSFDAAVIATGATVPRELAVDGRELGGVQLAMDYLVQANRVVEGSLDKLTIDAADKHVVIVGGGDTGADCYGTALRQGAASVTQLDIHREPPPTRHPSTPWPTYPLMLRMSAAHEEGGERVFGVNSTSLQGTDGRVTGLNLVAGTRVPGGFVADEGTDTHLQADLVLLALGFTGPERAGLLDGLGIELTERGVIHRDRHYATNIPGFFVAGDAGRGQSLNVWAIAEGRSAAAGVDAYLAGKSDLPDPLEPTAVALS
ncbi:MAG: FAD-dependent oxidoreductase, partial [Actinomycetota bacterium]|nr:FAD-dependent oxidoreductase [Actinomycetota bacterium]